MSTQRSSKAMWCGTFILMGGFVAVLTSFGSGSVERAGAGPLDRDVAARSDVVEKVDTARIHATPTPNVTVTADATTTAGAKPTPVAEAAAIPPPPNDQPAPNEPKPYAVASADPTQKLLSETPPVDVASAPDPVLEEAAAPIRAIKVPDECFVADICIDAYLWAFYERTPKQDTNKVIERRKVAVKRKGKKITVTKRFTKLVDADFTWKDPNAAERAGMPMMRYVIGGMDRGFKRKLLYMLRAAEDAGFSPGITSGFRDDYRQSIASGNKAATGRSYHGGSARGGYGHGVAADLVSTIGKTRNQRWLHSDRFWKWIDEHGKEFGIGRPYLDRDPPHVAPIDGEEFARNYWPPRIKPVHTAKKSDPQAGKAAPPQAYAALTLAMFNARRDQ